MAPYLLHLPLNPRHPRLVEVVKRLAAVQHESIPQRLVLVRPRHELVEDVVVPLPRHLEHHPALLKQVRHQRGLETMTKSRGLGCVSVLVLQWCQSISLEHHAASLQQVRRQRGLE